MPAIPDDITYRGCGPLASSAWLSHPTWWRLDLLCVRCLRLGRLLGSTLRGAAATMPGRCARENSYVFD